MASIMSIQGTRLAEEDPSSVAWHFAPMARARTRTSVPVAGSRFQNSERLCQPQSLTAVATTERTIETRNNTSVWRSRNREGLVNSPPPHFTAMSAASHRAWPANRMLHTQAALRAREFVDELRIGAPLSLEGGCVCVKNRVELSPLRERHFPHRERERAEMNGIDAAGGRDLRGIVYGINSSGNLPSAGLAAPRINRSTHYFYSQKYDLSDLAATGSEREAAPGQEARERRSFWPAPLATHAETNRSPNLLRKIPRVSGSYSTRAAAAPFRVWLRGVPW